MTSSLSFTFSLILSVWAAEACSCHVKHRINPAKYHSRAGSSRLPPRKRSRRFWQCTTTSFWLHPADVFRSSRRQLRLPRRIRLHDAWNFHVLRTFSSLFFPVRRAGITPQACQRHKIQPHRMDVCSRMGTISRVSREAVP